MDGKKIYVLAKQVLKEGSDEIDYVNICGVVSSMREARAWSIGVLHSVYETEVDGDIQADGIDRFEFYS